MDLALGQLRLAIQMFPGALALVPRPLLHSLDFTGGMYTPFTRVRYLAAAHPSPHPV